VYFINILVPGQQIHFEFRGHGDCTAAVAPRASGCPLSDNGWAKKLSTTVILSDQKIITCNAYKNGRTMQVFYKHQKQFIQLHWL
jgi:hypothetical protein